MKTNKLKQIATLSGLMIGAFALSVLAESYVWTPASCEAPNCNVAAPINVSDAVQVKQGALVLGGSSFSNGYALDVNGPGYFTGLTVAGTMVVNGLIVNGTDKDKSGYVLTNDGTGKAEWKPKGSASLTLTDVKSFQLLIPRDPSNNTSNVRSFTTTDSTYLFCALSQMGPDYANSDNVGSFCKVEKLNDGKWKLSGYRPDDPDTICSMTCFK